VTSRAKVDIAMLGGRRGKRRPKLHVPQKLRDEIWPEANPRDVFIWTPDGREARAGGDYARCMTPGDRPIPCEICGEIIWWDYWWDAHAHGGRPLFICMKHSDFEGQVWKASKNSKPVDIQ